MCGLSKQPAKHAAAAIKSNKVFSATVLLVSKHMPSGLLSGGMQNLMVRCWTRFGCHCVLQVAHHQQVSKGTGAELQEIADQKQKYRMMLRDIDCVNRCVLL